MMAWTLASCGSPRSTGSHPRLEENGSISLKGPSLRLQTWTHRLRSHHAPRKPEQRPIRPKSSQSHTYHQTGQESPAGVPRRKLSGPTRFCRSVDGTHRVALPCPHVASCPAHNPLSTSSRWLPTSWSSSRLGGAPHDQAHRRARLPTRRVCPCCHGSLAVESTQPSRAEVDGRTKSVGKVSRNLAIIARFSS